ncbi:MAG: LTA synthase family protein [Oligoflexales bacterium]|nr:LTA synthase family protein [Oligoflexales bacterium]
MIGDLVYFGHVGRHVFNELLQIGNDLEFLWREGVSTYLLYTMASGILVVIAGIFWFVFSRKPIVETTNKVIVFIAFLLLSAIGIRGSFGEKPLNVVDAFISDKSIAGQLALNGLFTAFHSSVNTEKTEYRVYKMEELKAILSPLRIDPSSEHPFYGRTASSKSNKESYFVEPKFPFGKRKLNFVVIMLESFGSFYVDAFSGKGFGATSNLDMLAQRGLVFPDFYATGSRSIEAIQSLLLSLPALKGLPTLGTGLESLKVTGGVELLSKGGYETFFSQSSKRGSFHLNSVARALGFDRYSGSEDYPRLLDYPRQKDPLFGWDYEMFMFTLERLNESRLPFFSFLFTGTTHTPFPLPPYLLKKEGHGDDNETGYLNTIYYTDKALGEFIRRAEKQPWFKDTVFFITADHTFPSYRKFGFLDSHKIPLVIYAPFLIAPGRIEKPATHLDILPTILDLSGIEFQISTAGKSLFLAGERDFAFIAGKYDNPALVMDGAFLRHSGRVRLESGNTANNGKIKEELAAILERTLLGFNQVLYENLLADRWFDKKNSFH